MKNKRLASSVQRTAVTQLLYANRYTLTAKATNGSVS
jgi:hypothetical protein